MAPHRAAWADLAARALEPSIFNDPAFLLPATLHLAGGRRTRFHLAWDPHDPNRLIGLCCVVRPNPGLPLSAWLHPQATAAFPLLDGTEAAAALAALLDQTGGTLRPAGLLLHGLPLEGATMRMIAGGRPRWSVALVESRSRAVVRGIPAPVAGKAGKEFRRQLRRLADLGNVTTTTTTAAAALDAFLDMEQKGWKGRRGTALAETPSLTRFVREMVTALCAERRCRIHSLTLDGRPIATGLVLRAGAHAFFWKTAFDETYARFSPGAHLAEAIAQAQACEPGIVLTDSCAVPGHSMIDRLWPERMTVVDAFVAPTPAMSLPHRLALGVERARRAARRWAKRMVASGWKRRPDRPPGGA